MSLTASMVRELTSLHLDVLYEWRGGRIVATRGGGPKPPSFHLIRSPAGNRWAVNGHSMAPEVLEAALSAEPVLATVDALEGYPPARVERASAERGIGLRGVYRGPAFVCRRRPDPAGGTLLIERLADVPPGVRGPLAWVHELTEQELPAAMVIENDVVLSVCHSARATGAAAEAGVETIEAARRGGLGRAVVAAWAAAMMDAGRRPLYSTTWDNRASRALAASLGFDAYGEDYHALAVREAWRQRPRTTAVSQRSD